MNAAWIRADWAAPGNVVAGTTLRSTRFDACAVPGEPCWLNQVHGARVVTAAAYDAPPDADASVCAESGRICVVRTADCMPALLSASDGTEVAAAHAGWRGLAAGILEATVAKMTHSARELLVWLGPAISQAAYEVGDEVRDAFVAADAGAAECFAANARGRWQADLEALARRRLAALGVREVSGGGYCTYTEKERFFSYRRNPDCGRMVSFIAIKPLENRGPDAI